MLTTTNIVMLLQCSTLFTNPYATVIKKCTVFIHLHSFDVPDIVNKHITIGFISRWYVIVNKISSL